MPKTINSDILRAAKIASKDQVRPILMTVNITEEKIMATDSYIGIIIDRSKNISGVDFPIIDADSKTEAVNLGEKGVCIPADQLIKKQKFAKGSTLPILDCGIISKISGDENNNNRKVEITTTDLETATKNIYREPEGNYPDVEMIFPTEEPKATVVLDVKLLQTLLTAFVSGDFEDKSIELQIFEKMQPMVIKGAGGLNKRFRGVIMPLKR